MYLLVAVQPIRIHFEFPIEETEDVSAWERRAVVDIRVTISYLLRQKRS